MVGRRNWRTSLRAEEVHSARNPGCALQRVDRSAPDYSSPRGQCAPASPICPSCAQVMRLARMTSRFGDLPDLYTFECRACGVSNIEPGFSASIAGALQLGACRKDLWTLATSETY